MNRRELILGAGAAAAAAVVPAASAISSDALWNNSLGSNWAMKTSDEILMDINDALVKAWEDYAFSPVERSSGLMAEVSHMMKSGGG